MDRNALRNFRTRHSRKRSSGGTVEPFPIANLADYDPAPSYTGKITGSLFGQSLAGYTPPGDSQIETSSANVLIHNQGGTAWATGSVHYVLTRLGKHILTNVAGISNVYFNQKAAGGTTLKEDWFPNGTLYNELIAKIATAEGQIAGTLPQFAMIFLGESEATSATTDPDFLSGFSVRVAKLVDSLRNRTRGDLGYIPIIWAQSGQRGVSSYNLSAQNFREQLRRLESGSGFALGNDPAGGLYKFHISVTHDLNLTDVVHQNSLAGLIHARRLELLTREKIRGEAIDGTGPRITSITRPTRATIQINFDKTVTVPVTTDATAYNNYFAVLDATGAFVLVSSITRPAATQIVIAHTSTAGLVQCRYMPPTNTTPDTVTAINYPNCIRGVTADALPLPAFTIPLS
jgi:hypothetical protein